MKTVVDVGERIARWIPAGVRVGKGDVIDIQASGTISFQNQSKAFGPDGQQTLPSDKGSVSAQLNAHALIGMISPSVPGYPVAPNAPARPPFLVGAAAKITAQDDGYLYLIANDNVDFFHDNVGTWTVTVQTGPTDIGTDQNLAIGVSYLSPGGAYSLEFQDDSNLTVYSVEKGVRDTAVWYLQKVLGDNFTDWHVPNRTAAFEKDGRLVVRNRGTELWASPLSDGKAHAGARLNLSDENGALTIVDGNQILWSSVK